MMLFRIVPETIDDVNNISTIKSYIIKNNLCKILIMVFLFLTPFIISININSTPLKDYFAFPTLFIGLMEFYLINEYSRKIQNSIACIILKNEPALNHLLEQSPYIDELYFTDNRRRLYDACHEFSSIRLAFYKIVSKYSVMVKSSKNLSIAKKIMYIKKEEQMEISANQLLSEIKKDVGLECFSH